MTAKATAVAPANIAFIKYWGARDLETAIPWNPSVSMTLTHCFSRTTAEVLSTNRTTDQVFQADPDGELIQAEAPFSHKVTRHLDRLRHKLGWSHHFRVATRNTFPSAAGIASSASGFAALALAATRASGLNPEPLELSRLARLSGSGSAARSALGGYVLWPEKNPQGELDAVSLFPSTHWQLADLVAVVDRGAKNVSSRDGHRRAETSPFFPARQEILAQRTESVIEAIGKRSLDDLGPLLEEEALELHCIAFSSRAPIFYWRPGTVEVLQEVRRWREDGLPAFWTMDAGPNVHVLTEMTHADEVARRLANLPLVKEVIRDQVGKGPSVLTEHLF